jgi:CSLREA domain-containing protein
MTGVLDCLSRSGRRLAVAVALAVTALLGWSAAEAHASTVTDIGTPAQFGTPIAINSADEVLSADVSTTNGQTPVVWSNGNFTTLNQLPLGSGETSGNAVAAAINDSGTVVGTDCQSNSEQGPCQIVTWAQGSSSPQVLSLTALDPSSNDDSPAADKGLSIDNEGDIGGFAQFGGSNAQYDGVYAPGGTSPRLLVSGSGAEQGVVALSDVAGLGYGSNAQFSDDGAQLFGAGMSSPQATSLCAVTGRAAGFMASDGAVVGHLWQESTGCTTTPVLQLPGGQPVPLLLGDAAASAVFVTGVNAAHTVVGAISGSSGYEATMWPVAAEPIDLNTLLPANSGWTLSSALAINNAGDIVGQGTLNGVTADYLLKITPVTPPVVNSAGDASAQNGGAQGCNTGATVMGTGGTSVPECTLRAAIQAENAGTVTAKTISFALPASANGTIEPTSVLPALTAPGVTINGASSSGVKVVLDGSSVVGASTVGLELSGANDDVEGMAFYVWNNAIKLDSPAGGEVVSGDRIGISATGTGGEGVGGVGVDVEGSPNNTIGGTTAAAGNLISEVPLGVLIRGAAASGNVVEGNLLGTDSTGTQPAGVGTGVAVVDASGTTIGGVSKTPGTAPGNLIDGPGGATGNGVAIGGQTATASGSLIEGNAIGLLANGNDPSGIGIGSGFGTGVASVGMTSGTVIGGSAAGDGNAIRGARIAEVSVDGTSVTGTKVLGNLIGTNLSGADAPASGTAIGIFVGGATHTTIGAVGAGANVITEQWAAGISVVPAATAVLDTTQNPVVTYPGTAATATTAMSTLITGNTIGPLADGNSLGSGTLPQFGINLAGIGDTVGPGNQIAGNDTGIAVGGSGESVVGNLIGTSRNGLSALPNGSGVIVTGRNAQIGVPGAEANTISGNLNNLILSADATVENNLIGTTSIGNAAIASFAGTPPASLSGTYSTQFGVLATSGAAGSQIGGTQPGFGNVISGNASDGLDLDAATLVQGNKIGVGSNGTTAVPNQGDGIRIDQAATLGALFPGGKGSTAAAGGNTIADNTKDGVDVDAGISAISVLSDSIYGNGLGIVLGSGANGGITAPPLIKATQGDHATTLYVVAPSGDAGGRVQIYRADSCTNSSAQGKALLDTLSVPGAGILLPELPLLPVGTELTATVTLSSGPSARTSQFSSCVSAEPARTSVNSASSTATTSSESVTLPATATCGGSGSCSVADTASTSTTSVAPHIAAAKRRVKARAPVRIGAASRKLAAKAVAVLKFKLTTRGFRLLKARHTLRIRVTVKIAAKKRKTLTEHLTFTLRYQRPAKRK